MSVVCLARHLAEREKQLKTLNSDVDAASWRQVLESESSKDEGLTAAGGASEKGNAEERKESFVCNVVPLSLALDQLGVSKVDLLKVDVEGDELAVLHGIDDNHWPNIRQVKRGGDKKHLNYSPTCGWIDERATMRVLAETVISQVHQIFWLSLVIHQPRTFIACCRSPWRCTTSTVGWRQRSMCSDPNRPHSTRSAGNHRLRARSRATSWSYPPH